MKGAFRSVILCLVVLGTGGNAFGEGGPPLIGDDPGTPGNGRFEINVPYIYLRTSETTVTDFPYVDANYGLGDHIELTYQGGWLEGRPKGGDEHRGYDNSLVGVKWRFLDEEKIGVDMSVYPQLGFNTTRSLIAPRLAEAGRTFYLPFEIAKTIGKLELDAEAGYQFNQHDRGQWAGGPIVGYLLSDKIELLAEARFLGDQSFRTNDMIIDLGTRVTLTDYMQLLVAAGRSVRSGDDSARLYLYAGLCFTF